MKRDPNINVLDLIMPNGKPMRDCTNGKNAREVCLFCTSSFVWYCLWYCRQ